MGQNCQIFSRIKDLAYDKKQIQITSSQTEKTNPSFKKIIETYLSSFIKFKK
jgi:hypothetical protein